ncbi:hypothetical protein OROGR_011954 [Orobanche gracilis]
MENLAFIVIIFTSVLFPCTCGVNITVGGAFGWDLRSNIQAWASRVTFIVGDDLVFSYTPAYNVIEVNQAGYELCSIDNPLAAYDMGDTVIHLAEPGVRYFVCGRISHCRKGLKLQVHVVAVAAAPPSNKTADASHPAALTPLEVTFIVIYIILFLLLICLGLQFYSAVVVSARHC